jgi:glutathione peroxidase
MSFMDQFKGMSGLMLDALRPAKLPRKKTDKKAHEFSFKALAGGAPMPLKDYEGKVLLVVNTASFCGFTPQYAALEALYKEYRDKGLVILGVPSNDFGRQEPGSEQEIKEFCDLNYGVTFPMGAKVQTVGEGAHPFYQWISTVIAPPHWNFNKYLIGKGGAPLALFTSWIKPDSGTMKRAVEKALGA